jgi:hypothetical protein
MHEPPFRVPRFRPRIGKQQEQPIEPAVRQQPQIAFVEDWHHGCTFAD